MLHFVGRSFWLRSGILAIAAVLGLALGVRLSLAEYEYPGNYYPSPYPYGGLAGIGGLDVRVL